MSTFRTTAAAPETTVAFNPKLSVPIHTVVASDDSENTSGSEEADDGEESENGEDQVVDEDGECHDNDEDDEDVDVNLSQMHIDHQTDHVHVPFGASYDPFHPGFFPTINPPNFMQWQDINDSNYLQQPSESDQLPLNPPPLTRQSGYYPTHTTMPATVVPTRACNSVDTGTTGSATITLSVCKHWMQNKCRFGRSCRFVHVLLPLNLGHLMSIPGATVTVSFPIDSVEKQDVDYNAHGDDDEYSQHEA